MQKYSTIFFDLDGTLTDPGVGITNAVMHALQKFDISVPERTALYRFIGPPLMDSFQTFYGFSQEKAAEAVGFFRAYYAETGIFENVEYAGVAPMLQQLKCAGKMLVVATSKPEKFAVKILERFDLARYFDEVCGATFDDSRTKKDEVIAYALNTCAVSKKDAVLMVGDREHDILGAKKNALDSVGVLYGYGDRAEMERAGATYIAETVQDLRQLLLNDSEA